MSNMQFKFRPPKFNGVVWTSVLVLEQEMHLLLEKGVIEHVPPPVRESKFYSRYFIVPKKDGWLYPIRNLMHLNQSLRRFRFKMLTISIIFREPNSIPGLVYQSIVNQKYTGEHQYTFTSPSFHLTGGS